MEGEGSSGASEKLEILELAFSDPCTFLFGADSFKMSDTQQKVIELRLEGLNHHAIAYKLGISYQTSKNVYFVLRTYKGIECWGHELHQRFIDKLKEVVLATEKLS